MAAKFANRTFRVNVDSDNFESRKPPIAMRSEILPIQPILDGSASDASGNSNFHSIGIRMEVDQDMGAQATLD